MTFWQKLRAFFTRHRREKKRQEEWAGRFNQPPAQPKNPTPIDDEPWRT